MKTGMNLQALAAEIERRANEKRDFIAPVAKLEMTVVPAAPGDELGRLLDRPLLTVCNGHRQTFEPNAVAHGQLAEYAGIPLGYYKRMQSEQPHLLASNVNTWLNARDTSDRRMVRTLGNTARAFLSDKYRPLENEDLAEVILPVLLDQDLLIMSCDITDTRLYIKAVDRRIEKDVPTGRKMGDGSHVFFDTCSPAIIVSNSEVGCGALAIETGVYTKVCTNLAMIGTNMRKYHTGARAAVSDEVYALLTDDTKRKTDAAVWGQVRDLVKAGFDRARFDATCAKLGDAAQQRLGDDPMEVVERVGRRYNLPEGERKGILSRLIEGADLTRYGLHSAITRHSADVPDYDRATDLERLGGDVIELGKQEWERLLKAA